MKTAKTQLILNGILILGISTLTGCGIFKKDKESSESSDESAAKVIADDATVEEEVVRDEIGVDAENLDGANMKVRSYQQFYATYGVLLGIPSDNAAFKTAFEDVETNLPTTSSAKSFSGSHQLAAVKLASAGCDIAYDLASNEEKRSKFGIDFSSGTPLAVFSTDNRILMAKNLISKFWNKDISTITDADEDVVEVAGLIEGALAAISTADPATTDAVLIKAATIGACGAVLSSLPVSFY